MDKGYEEYYFSGLDLSRVISKYKLNTNTNGAAGVIAHPGVTDNSLQSYCSN